MRLRVRARPCVRVCCVACMYNCSVPDTVKLLEK